VLKNIITLEPGFPISSWVHRSPLFSFIKRAGWRNPMGEKTKETLKLQFDKRLRLEFHGVRMPHRELKWEIPNNTQEK